LGKGKNLMNAFCTLDLW